MSPQEKEALKEALTFFGKYFGIPLMVIVILFLVGVFSEPEEVAISTPYIYTADTSELWDTVSFK